MCGQHCHHAFNFLESSSWWRNSYTLQFLKYNKGKRIVSLVTGNFIACQLQRVIRYRRKTSCNVHINICIIAACYECSCGEDAI
jgi:hypothetical protein